MSSLTDPLRSLKIIDTETENFAVDTCPGSCWYEYAVATMNIEKTLATEYYIHSVYKQTHGTIPLDSEESASRVWDLIRQYMHQFGLLADTEVTSELQCPLFIPSRHLVLVKRVYGSQDHGRQADVFPVAVLERGTTVNEVPMLDGLDKSAYVALEPALSFQPDYPVFRTNRPILTQYNVYQNVYFENSCSVGSITDGPVTTFLEPESVAQFPEASSRAKKAASAFHRFCEAKDTEKGRGETNSVSTLGDIVYDFDRSAVHKYRPIISNTKSSEFLAERTKVMRLLDHWAIWFLHHPLPPLGYKSQRNEPLLR